MVDEHAGVAMMGCVSNGRQIGYRARARSSEAAKNGIKVRRLITQYGNYNFLHDHSICNRVSIQFELLQLVEYVAANRYSITNEVVIEKSQFRYGRRPRHGHDLLAFE